MKLLFDGAYQRSKRVEVKKTEKISQTIAKRSDCHFEK